MAETETMLAVTPVGVVPVLALLMRSRMSSRLSVAATVIVDSVDAPTMVKLPEMLWASVWLANAVLEILCAVAMRRTSIS